MTQQTELEAALQVADYDSRDVCGMDASNRAYNAKQAYREKYGKYYGYVIEQAARAHLATITQEPKK